MTTVISSMATLMKAWILNEDSDNTHNACTHMEKHGLLCGAGGADLKSPLTMTEPERWIYCGEEG